MNSTAQSRPFFCSFLSFFCVTLTPSLPPSLSLSLSLPLLASTDRFHNHFSEVTVSSAVVTQPLACSVSFTYAHELCAHTHTHTLHHSRALLHYRGPGLKETARVFLPAATTCYRLHFLRVSESIFGSRCSKHSCAAGKHTRQPVAEAWKRNTGLI